MKNIRFVDKNKLFALLLIVIWVCPALLINPVGDFPLNDDFSFGRTVYNLSELGILQFDDWLSMTLLTQVLWGAAFTQIFGFSFTVLRFSTLLIGVAGLLGLYYTACGSNEQNKIAFFGALVFAFNPLFFSLSYTFMTDVPFISLVSISILFYYKFFRSEQLQWFLLANVFALAALFVRQLGLLLPLAFTLAWWLHKKGQWRAFLTGMLPLVAATLIYTLYMEWFAATQGIPETFGTFPKLFKRLHDDNFLSVTAYRLGLLLLYAGLFMLPYNLLILKKPENRRVLYHTIGWCLVGTWLLWQGAAQFPAGNIFYNLGLGPKTLKDGFYFINVAPMLPLAGMKALAAVGAIGGILLIINLVAKIAAMVKPGNPVPVASLFTGLCMIIYGGFLMLGTLFFDRYFIPLFLFTILFLKPQNWSLAVPSPFAKAVALSWWLLVVVFSVGATHDYLSWNRTRWLALDYLEKKLKMTPHEIDGGLEYNGWHRPVQELNYGAFESWWWVDQENYLITFGSMDGFKKVKGFPFQTYLPPAVDSVYILQKN